MIIRRPTPFSKVLPVVQVQQNDTMLCWAACIESLSCYYKKCVPQITAFEIKHNLPFGTCKLQSCNIPSDSNSAAYALSQSTGASFVAYQVTDGDRNSLLSLFFNLINSGVPFILNKHRKGAQIGHAVVCCGVKYIPNSLSNLISVTEFISMDPSRGQFVAENVSNLITECTSIIVLEQGINFTYASTNNSNHL